jgi:hypothetical protein
MVEIHVRQTKIPSKHRIGIPVKKKRKKKERKKKRKKGQSLFSL